MPASKPDRYAGAITSGADLVCIDLEDAVAPQDKVSARQQVVRYVPVHKAGSTIAPLGVRINPLVTALGVTDAAALLDIDLGKLAFVMLPKVEHEEVIVWAAALFPPHVELLPIIESARGLDAAPAIFAHARVSAAIFGAVDYSAEVGCDLSFNALHMPRARLLNAAAMHEVTLLDSPFIDVHDLPALRAEILETRALGMRARSAIHPAQIDVIHSALAPSAAERAHAQRVVDAFVESDGGVTLLDGKLIELPVIKAARRLLER